MALYDEEELKKEAEKNKKTKKMILIGITSTIVLIIILMIVIALLIRNPNKITVYLDGAQSQELYDILDINKEENGTTSIDVSIMKIANFFGYKTNYGGYTSNTESKDSCYVITNNEIIIFNLGSDIVYKLDKTSNNSKYETAKLKTPIFRKENDLYINVYSLDEAFNILTYKMDEKEKKLYVTTLNSLIKTAQSIAIAQGYQGIDPTFVNEKAILDNMIVVVDKDKKMGVIDGKGTKILGTQYDKLIYIPSKKAFQVTISGKVGIISSDGTEIISPKFTELYLIDNELGLYIARSNRGLYGIVNKRGETLIYLEYNQIGVDITNFQENGLKTGYILLDEIIPVKKDGKWGFYKIKKDENDPENVTCEKITEFEYDNIGCVVNSKVSSIFNLMVIDDYGLIIVEKDKKYGFLDKNGTRFGYLTNMYIEIRDGEKKYYMTTEGEQTLNILEELEKRENKNK